jgi:hypothetical protein
MLNGNSLRGYFVVGRQWRGDVGNREAAASQLFEGRVLIDKIYLPMKNVEFVLRVVTVGGKFPHETRQVNVYKRKFVPEKKYTST